jgi:AmmeMemoRadiSam system protein A
MSDRPEPVRSEEALARLPGLAVDAIAHTLRTAERVLPDVRALPPELARLGAVFVTLERDRDLLGCIGTLSEDEPIGVVAARCGINAAFDDPRLPPITAADYAAMDVEVSVLSPLERLPVDSYGELADRLLPGIDGVLVERKNHRATFLPAVWAKVEDPLKFLDALWHKAALVPGQWDRHVRIWTYTTIEVVDRGPRAF